MNITLRGKTWMLYRRVPKRYAPVHSGKFVKISLKTDSRSVAEAKAPLVWQQHLDGWEAKLAGDTADAERAFEAARSLAEARGFRYLPAQAVADLPTGEIVDRLEAVKAKNMRSGAPVDTAEAAAVAGGVEVPKITISRALGLYWSLAADRVRGKSADQLRRWRNPRMKAIKNLVAVIGDKALSDISGDDMLEFREWWMEKLETDGLTPNSANKDLIHLGDVLKTVNKMKRLGLVLPLTDLSFKQDDVRTRPPFTDKWIREKLLASGALDGLNAEARAILLVMINTGMRPSEVAALSQNTIFLTANVPHLSVEPEGRQLKTKNSRRKIALVGCSLEAMRAFPGGFPRYRGSSAGLSATVNKYLREHGLLETPLHSLYSLRHAFEDRMLSAGVDERVRRDLLGHALNRERYGAGATLEMQAVILQPVAL